MSQSYRSSSTPVTWARASTGVKESQNFLLFCGFILLVINLVSVFCLRVLPWFSPTSLRVWKKWKRKGRYLFQLLVGRQSEMTEILLWFDEGFFILPLDKSPLSDQDGAGARRYGVGEHVQSIRGCLPRGREHKGTTRTLAAKPGRGVRLGGLVGHSPLQPNRNLLWGHSHEHDGPIFTFLAVFHSLPVRERERSFLGCCRKMRGMLVL